MLTRWRIGAFIPYMYFTISSASLQALDANAVYDTAVTTLTD